MTKPLISEISQIQQSKIGDNSATNTTANVNPGVHNFRLVSPTIEAFKNLSEVLAHSLSIPISDRGVSILVVSKEILTQSQPHEVQQLREELQNQGVRLTPMESVETYINKHYPAIPEFLNLLSGLPLPLQPDTEKTGKEEAHNRIKQLLIHSLLPDYAFSTNKDGKLTTVTVANEKLLSSLFLPAETSAEKIDILDATFWIGDTQRRYLMDGRDLSYLILPSSNAENQAAIRPALGAAPDVFSLTSSAPSAKIRADIVNDICELYISNKMFSTPFYKHEDSLKNMTSLRNFTTAFPDQPTDVCFIEKLDYDSQTTNFNVRCADNYPDFINYISITFSKLLSQKSIAPILKEQALKYKIEWRNTYSGSSDQSAGFTTDRDNPSSYKFYLQRPDFSFYSEKRENLEAFLKEVALNADIANIHTLLPDSTRNFGFPENQGGSPCNPVIKVTDLPNRTHPNINILEVNQDMVLYQNSLKSCPHASKICLPYLRTPVAKHTSPNPPSAGNNGTSSPNPAITGSIDETGNEIQKTLDSAKQAASMGALSGAIHGIASYCGKESLVEHPLYRAATGYLIGGPIGCAINVAAYALNKAPAYLRKDAHPLRNACASTVEIVNKTLPFMMGGVTNFLVASGSHALGKYGTEKALTYFMGDKNKETINKASLPGLAPKKTGAMLNPGKERDSSGATEAGAIAVMIPV